MKHVFAGLAVLMIVFSSCKTSRKVLVGTDDQQIQLVLVQLNDVYEIAPLAGGATGGMARAATVKKELLRSNPNTFMVMAGDFLSPSIYNSLKFEGKRIRGRQMIDVMNTAGVDLAIFGNHEFDITSTELQERLNESKFQWVVSNSFYKNNDSTGPFVRYSEKGPEPLPETYIIDIKDKDGTTARVGFIGITLPFNTSDYVSYTDPQETATRLYNRLKDSVDAVIAITHQTVKQDSILATKIPTLPIIIGGHEHDMRFKKTGNVFITKAHANARSAFIVTLNINKKDKTVTVDPQLKELDTSVAFDSATNVIVNKWGDIANQNYASIGFDPSRVIVQKGDSLEGRENYTRSGTTNMTDMIVRAMAYAAPHAELVIMNSGSIRLDDILYPPVSEYDILRSLPFGGSIVEVDMQGSLLEKVLDAGRKNKGSGGFLLSYPVIDKIDPDKVYRVGLSDFLLTGGEANLGFLKKTNPGILKVYPEPVSNSDPRTDIRLAIIRYLISH